ncbi:AcrR family transcriptional regulator [Nakamurella sp. UYEF19]|uniref:TetR family transcriptional regulator n=1 Tax=Nakamurella sp. UYEF19 TaxID=1756392 RepID=UPI0033976D62
MVSETRSRRAPSRSGGTRAERAGTTGELTREAVIEVALSLADVEGLANVTIRRLAQHFRVTPMALYWHVKNKDELLDAMGDQVFAGLQVPGTDDEPWDATYRTLLDVLLQCLRAHPGAVELAGLRVLHNEKGLDLTERALSLLRGAGLSVQASADVARTSLQTMMMLVSVQPGVERGAPQSEWDALMAEKSATLAALPTERYPNLVECAVALIDCEDENVYYDSGVDLFLDGVRAQVAAL